MESQLKREITIIPISKKRDLVSNLTIEMITGNVALSRIFKINEINDLSPKILSKLSNISNGNNLLIGYTIQTQEQIGNYIQPNGTLYLPGRIELLVSKAEKILPSSVLTSKSAIINPCICALGSNPQSSSSEYSITIPRESTLMDNYFTVNFLENYPSIVNYNNSPFGYLIRTGSSIKSGSWRLIQIQNYAENYFAVLLHND